MARTAFRISCTRLYCMTHKHLYNSLLEKPKRPRRKISAILFFIQVFRFFFISKISEVYLNCSKPLAESVGLIVESGKKSLIDCSLERNSGYIKCKEYSRKRRIIASRDLEKASTSTISPPHTTKRTNEAVHLTRHREQMRRFLSQEFCFLCSNEAIEHFFENDLAPYSLLSLFEAIGMTKNEMPAIYNCFECVNAEVADDDNKKRTEATEQRRRATKTSSFCDVLFDSFMTFLTKQQQFLANTTRLGFFFIQYYVKY